ncbi:sodium- and chloride-dependent GABA transporter 1-like [Artemia franciscana]|uniref:Transporter n=1 Tax=Artemia franciscana TaxID=6661 RepID=A0AA88HGC1_ARTSF|nr:hypothetical protein QYM36_012611 [Artemia franciscana]
MIREEDIKSNGKENLAFENLELDEKKLNEKTLVGDIEQQDEEDERGGWGNQLDFLMSCISVSVGLGNVWRFPYLAYKNGGGAFLIPYFIAMVLCGIPIFFQEVATGQYLGSGGMTFVGTIAPMFQGVGFASTLMVSYINMYYCVIISWTLWYFIQSFVAIPDLPWDTCSGWWNDPSTCYLTTLDEAQVPNETHFFNVSSVEQFWDRRCLQRTETIDDLGNIQWEIFGCLIIGWILVYLIIWKGLHNSGKIIWFTALFPYVIIVVLLVRAVTLPGADVGMLAFITPQWDLLLTASPWIDGFSQIFFAYSVGMGVLPSLGSYNKFKHNCYRDAIITCVVNTGTSLLTGTITFAILGNLAQSQNQTIDDVATEGPGLLFIVYPSAVLELPGSPAWSAIFFGMVLIIGIDSQFCNVEAFITGMVDFFPVYLRPRRRWFTLISCIVFMLLGIPMVTQGGVFLFQLMDSYSASGITMLWVVTFQTIVIYWTLGRGMYRKMIAHMLDRNISIYFEFCWGYIAPVVMTVIFIFYCATYEPIKYGGFYTYPPWAEVIAWLISLSSMIMIPGYAIYFIIINRQVGSIKEIWCKGTTPIFKARKGALFDPSAARINSEVNDGVSLPTAESKADLVENAVITKP